MIYVDKPGDSEWVWGGTFSFMRILTWKLWHLSNLSHQTQFWTNFYWETYYPQLVLLGSGWIWTLVSQSSVHGFWNMFHCLNYRSREWSCRDWTVCSTVCWNRGGCGFRGSRRKWDKGCWRRRKSLWRWFLKSIFYFISWKHNYRFGYYYYQRRGSQEGKWSDRGWNWNG